MNKKSLEAMKILFSFNLLAAIISNWKPLNAIFFLKQCTNPGFIDEKNLKLWMK